MSQIVKEILRLRSLGVVKSTKITPPDGIGVMKNVSTGEDILCTHVESVTQFKLRNNSHSLNLIFSIIM